MTNLRSNLFVLILALTCFASCQSQDKKQNAKQGLEFSARLGGIVYLDTISTIHIATTLYNPTKDTLSFVTMICSYENMFLTDTSIFKIQSRYDCFSNAPAVRNIAPGEKLDQYIMIRAINSNIKAWEHKVKIGMYMIEPDTTNGFQGIIKQYENRKSAPVLWSDTLDLERLYRRSYK